MFHHAWAAFRADFPEDPDPAESRCEGLGQFLATSLRQTGVAVTGTDCWRDCGWEIDCRINGKAIYCFISYVGQGSVEYALCCTSNHGLIAWLRGINDLPERWELARHIHRVVSTDKRFLEIRWYPESGWTNSGDEPYTLSPP